MKSINGTWTDFFNGKLRFSGVKSNCIITLIVKFNVFVLLSIQWCMTQRGINVYRPARFEHLLKWSRFHGEDHLLWNEYYKKKRLCEKYSEDKKLKFYSVCAIKKKKRLKSKLFFQLIGYDMMFPVWETLSRQLTHKQLKKKGISCRESKIVHPLKWHFSAVPTMIVFVCFSSKFPFEGPVKLITVVQRWLFYLCLAFPELQTRKFLQWCRSRAVKEHRKCFTPVYVLFDEL